nr:MAG TPA: hypothetical protein [Caudoviricetes sp.]
MVTFEYRKTEYRLLKDKRLDYIPLATLGTS